jgi:hypothetical protein
MISLHAEGDFAELGGGFFQMKETRSTMGKKAFFGG